MPRPVGRVAVLSVAVLAAGIMILSLKRMVATRTRELNTANRLLVQENEMRQKAQLMLKLQRDLAIGMSACDSLEKGMVCLLENLLTIPGVDAGGIYLIDETGWLRLRAHRGLSGKFVDAFSTVGPEDPKFKLVAGRKTVLQAVDARPFKDEGLRAVLVVPICVGPVLLGTLNVASRTLAAFPEDKVTGLEAIGLQIGSIVDRIKAQEQLRESEQAYRTLTDGSFDTLLITGMDGIIRFANKRVEEVLGFTAQELVGRHGNSLVSPAQAETMMNRFRDRVKGLPAPSHYECVLVRKDGRPVPGALSIRLAEWRGEKAVLIFFTDLTEHKRLEQAVLRISQWEKRRIGHDLHDSLGQQMAGIAYLCRALEDDLEREQSPSAEVAVRLGGLLRKAIDELRLTVRGLAPVDIEEGGLAPALARLAEAMGSYSGQVVRFEDKAENAVADLEVAAHLYHVAQEAVNNAIRHGKARRVVIRLSGNAQRGELVIEDDGAGFNPDQPAKEGSGLKIMQYRAGVVGGSLAIKARDRGGVTVRCGYDITLAGYQGEAKGHDEQAAL